jgi:hypothetical protein
MILRRFFPYSLFLNRYIRRYDRALLVFFAICRSLVLLLTVAVNAPCHK